MASFERFNQFVEDLADGVHDLSASGNALSFALFPAATAPATTDSILSDIGTPNAINNLLGTIVFAKTSSTQNPAGTYNLTLTNKEITADGGALPTFRYIVVYNSETSAKTNPLIGFYDYEGDVDLLDGETFTISFTGAFVTLTSP